MDPTETNGWVGWKHPSRLAFWIPQRKSRWFIQLGKWWIVHPFLSSSEKSHATWHACDSLLTFSKKDPIIEPSRLDVYTPETKPPTFTSNPPKRTAQKNNKKWFNLSTILWKTTKWFQQTDKSKNSEVQPVKTKNSPHFARLLTIQPVKQKKHNGPPCFLSPPACAWPRRRGPRPWPFWHCKKPAIWWIKTELIYGWFINWSVWFIDFLRNWTFHLAFQIHEKKGKWHFCIKFVMNNFPAQCLNHFSEHDVELLSARRWSAQKKVEPFWIHSPSCSTKFKHLLILIFGAIYLDIK